jgi:hypothetical protein
MREEHLTPTYPAFRGLPPVVSFATILLFPCEAVGLDGIAVPRAGKRCYMRLNQPQENSRVILPRLL